MGVPAFFRWLSEKFPKIIIDVIETEQQDIGGVPVPVDTSQPNPNGVEYDNLYLDMNNIIHPCFHPEDKESPKSEEEVMIAIMLYIDRLFAIVRPRKLLFMAIDGVAPRAKMNQQRSRRFRTAKEAAEKKEIEERIRKDLEAQGPVPPKKEGMEVDSNCITPGTAFMQNVATSLQYYITERVQTDPGWKGINIILSDSNVPGEGEHKIMEFIRLQRSQPNYDPNTRHVIYGLDADLIMLGLATHEPHFSILREVVFIKNNNNCYICGQPGHLAYECKGKPREEDERNTKKKPYQFLHLNVLREYLNNQLFVENLPFDYSLERVIDDWVFLCFFVGNDFLPHLPTLEIRENAIGTLTKLYKQMLPHTGYLTKDGEVDLLKVKRLLFEIAQLEDSILVNRMQNERRAKERRQRQNFEQGYKRKRVEEENASKKNLEAAAALRAALLGEISVEDTEPKTKKMRGTHQSQVSRDEEGSKSKQLLKSADEVQEAEDIPDPVRLGEVGWKERYYKTKFNVEMTDKEFFHQFATSYIEGLVWVLRYYYKGCCSWKWYYPYHYAPFASELVIIPDNFEFSFELGTPFSPLEQLMSVLPSASASIVPPAYRQLMTDPDSPIIDFYPQDFVIDLNGKKMAWQGVALLPFIDENRLLQTLHTVEQTLTPEEKKRNSIGPNILFVHSHHPLTSVLTSLYDGGNSSDWISVGPPSCGNLFGFVSRFNNNRFKLIYPAPFPGAEDIKDCQTISAVYRNPNVPPTGILRGLLRGVILPPPVTTPEDFLQERNYRTQNHVANRLINSQIDNSSRQYKPIQSRHNRHDDYYHPYRSRQDERNSHSGDKHESNRFYEKRHDNRPPNSQYPKNSTYEPRGASDHSPRQMDNRRIEQGFSQDLRPQQRPSYGMGNTQFQNQGGPPPPLWYNHTPDRRDDPRYTEQNTYRERPDNHVTQDRWTPIPSNYSHQHSATRNQNAPINQTYNQVPQGYHQVPSQNLLNYPSNYFSQPNIQNFMPYQPTPIPSGYVLTQEPSLSPSNSTSYPQQIPQPGNFVTPRHSHFQ